MVTKLTGQSPSAPYSSTIGIRESSEITRHYVLLAVEEALRPSARKITRLLCRPENISTIISIIAPIIKLVYITYRYSWVIDFRN